jgi:2-succinyl-5-enolpyruvyl-6-hydroxy-3-cyclohexene-1-carboxylate synthase
MDKTKTQSRWLPSAVRRRSFRSASVPAVSPLHFTFPLAEPLTEANVKYSDLEKADSCAVTFNFLLAYNPSSARFLTIQHDIQSITFIFKKT